MKIQIWSIGKNHEPWVKPGVEEFTKRISRYFRVEWNLIPVPKHTAMLGESDLKKREAETILGFLQQSDFLVALDGNGTQMSSEQTAGFLQKRANEGVKNLVFLIGGAYGIGDAVLNRAEFTWSLSRLVFPHQLVRVILAEQLYRACTILQNEKYHHGRPN